MKTLISLLTLCGALYSCDSASTQMTTPSPTSTPIPVIMPSDIDTENSKGKIPVENFSTPIRVEEPPEQERREEMPLLSMSPTNKVNRFGNPIYKIEMFANNKLIDTVYGVSGRASTQTANRNISGTKAPLPNGRYKVAVSPIAGASREVGKLFLPITPLFNTGRYDLGFHVDPSFDKDPREDGTDGCIGLTSVVERDRLFTFVRDYKPKYLEVQI